MFHWHSCWDATGIPVANSYQRDFQSILAVLFEAQRLWLYHLSRLARCVPKFPKPFVALPRKYGSEHYFWEGSTYARVYDRNIVPRSEKGVAHNCTPFPWWQSGQVSALWKLSCANTISRDYEEMQNDKRCIDLHTWFSSNENMTNWAPFTGTGWTD